MTTHPLLQPYKPTSDNPFDAVKAAHLLNRAGFGGTVDEIEQVRKMGPIDAVDWLFDFPDAGAEEQSQTDVPDLSAVAGYPKSYKEIAKKMKGLSEEERKEARQEMMTANREALKATIDWWLTRMAMGSSPLQEKLTLFWHGHFATSARDERSAALMWQQNDLLREQAAGNFRTLVRSISRDPAMLDYLNNTQNKKAHPNENYARELQELFTLGIGNYTETDVKQAARAFTGWTHDGEQFVFRPHDHDDGIKTFQGHTGNFNGEDVIAIILSMPVCSKFISSKLFRFFAYEQPDDTLVDALGSQLREQNYALRPLIRTILTSKAFYSDYAMGTQIKSPIQLLIGTVRQLNLQMPNDRATMGYLTQMGQQPFGPPNVRGWPGGRIWINTNTMFVRTNMGVYLAGGGAVQVARVGRIGGSTKGGGKSVEANAVAFDPNKTHSEADTPETVVDAWLAKLIQRPVDPVKREVLVKALAGPPLRTENVRKMIQLIVSMPEYQLC